MRRRGYLKQLVWGASFKGKDMREEEKTQVEREKKRSNVEGTKTGGHN